MKTGNLLNLARFLLAKTEDFTITTTARLQDVFIKAYNAAVREKLNGKNR